MSGALKARVGGAWTYVKGIKGDAGPAGPPSVGLTTLTSDYNQTIRQVGPSGGPYQLLFRRNKDYFLNDRSDVDATGATDMGATITTYLAEAQTKGFRHVYCDPGSTYLTSTTITVPANLTLAGPLRMDQAANAAHTASIKASADNVTILQLAGLYATVDGMKVDLNYRLNAVGVQPNNHLQLIANCLFSHADATATGVKGGQILYFAMRDNIFSDAWNGRAVDIQNGYGTLGGYYGVNVGWFERIIFAGGPGAFRASGIFTVRDCDFEGGSGSINPALTVGESGIHSDALVEGNYFEMSGNAQAILFTGDSRGTVRRNDIYGGNVAGSYGLEWDTAITYREIVGNAFNGVQTGVILSLLSANIGGELLVANYFNNNVTTPVSGGAVGWDYSTNVFRPSVQMRGDHRVTYHTALVGGSVSCDNITTSPLDLDLRKGNLWTIQANTPLTVTCSNNANVGQVVALFNSGTSAITLPSANWTPREGTTATLQPGEGRLFITHRNGSGFGTKPRELGTYAKAMATKTATFTADASADVYLCDATSAAFTATLPSAATWTGGPLTVKKTDSSANAVTVGTTSSQTIDGAPSIVLRTSGHAVTVRPSAGNWQTVATTPGAHLTSSGSTPAIAAGTGAGTTPTVSISGADTAGTITVTTGTSPAASATVVTITFTASYGTTPKSILIDPCGVNSAALTGTGRVYEDQASRTATTFALKVGSTALAASTTYTFSYQTIG